MVTIKVPYYSQFFCISFHKFVKRLRKENEKITHLHGKDETFPIYYSSILGL